MCFHYYPMSSSIPHSHIAHRTREHIIIIIITTYRAAQFTAYNIITQVKKVFFWWLHARNMQDKLESLSYHAGAEWFFHYTGKRCWYTSAAERALITNIIVCMNVFYMEYRWMGSHHSNHHISITKHACFFCIPLIYLNSYPIHNTTVNQTRQRV